MTGRPSIGATYLRLLSVEPAQRSEDGQPAVIIWGEDLLSGQSVRVALDPGDAAELADQITAVLGPDEADDQGGG